jgi:hypothetical protein
MAYFLWNCFFIKIKAMALFAELDDLYKSTVSKLPTRERLYYCEKHLASAQRLLEKHSGIMDSYQKNNVRSLVKAIQNEIKKLENK